MKVPFFLLSQQNTRIKQEVMEGIERVIDSSTFILGSEVERLERLLSDYIGASEVVTVSSGTEALRLSLLAAGIGPGDKVITVSNSYFATAAAIVMVGAEPVFLDVDPRTMVLDVSILESVLDSQTKAVIPVHYNGYPCEMNQLKAIADAYGLLVVEDCAQAMGSRFEGKHVGSECVGCFSLHPLKVLGAYGDAGFITTNDANFADRLRQYRNNGLIDRDSVGLVTGNYRMDTLQAAVVLTKIKYFDSWIDRRIRIAQYYIDNIKGCELPYQKDDRVLFNFSSFVIRSESRDWVLAQLHDMGVEAKVQYPKGIHQQAPYRRYVTRDLPVTEKIQSRMLSLPVASELSDEQVEYVVDCVNKIMRASA